jgi:omega-amidase
MQDLKITIVQSSLYWESQEENRSMFSKKISLINEETDVIILPEMFSTGFSMNPEIIAEAAEGESFQWMKEIAKERNVVIAGSIATSENGQFFNRFYWVQPDGKHYQYDKKHLFTFAGENKKYTAGKDIVIIKYKGWKIKPLICYDLRFPVWSKNNFSEENGYDYDCLIYVANWPQPRSNAWKSLLVARAIENQCYCIGVNRVGTDLNKNQYSGDSAVINPKGEIISTILPGIENINTSTISLNELNQFRQSFKLGPDWDKFTIE